jgi:hypothetical protein
LANTTFDLKTFILSHAIWVVAAVVAVIGWHAWIGEHDQRLAAEAAIKTSQAAIATLQQQIQQTDAQAAQKTQTIVKIVHDLGPAPTTGQIVAAVPQITDAPLNARVITNDPTNITVAAVPFLQFVQQAATDKVNLAACTSDLANEKAIGVQKDAQIAVLKKKPSFLHRVASVAKAVGIGIAIGALLAHGV